MVIAMEKVRRARTRPSVRKLPRGVSRSCKSHSDTHNTMATPEEYDKLSKEEREVMLEFFNIGVLSLNFV